MQQFFISAPLAVGGHVIFPADIERQLRRVLRVRGGETVRLIDAEGMPFLARLVLKKNGVEADCVEALQERRELSTPIILAPARIKKEKWEWMLQKATELGVSEIWPLLTERVNESEPTPNRLVREHRILQEAAEQCERHRIPCVRETLSLEKLLTVVRQRDDFFAIVLAERQEEKAPPLSEVLDSVAPGKTIVLIIGPEGGFSSNEFARFAEEGVAFAGLGPRILRAETAAILSVGMAAQLLERRARNR